MSELTRRLAALGPEKQKLLWKRVAEEGGAASAFQLSFAQERLWFLDRLTPGSPLYNLAAPVRLAGQLDLAALAASRDEIVRRHEVLRTTFLTLAGFPVQVVSPPEAGEPLHLVDLQALPAHRREAEGRALANAAARVPFDLGQGSLLRLTLLRLGSEDHVLLLTAHHIVCDGWSVGIFLRELTALYATFSAGAPPALPPLPIQYRDFARWQRRWLSGERLASLLVFWKESLAGAPAEMPLPVDAPRRSVPSFRGAGAPVALTPAVSAAIKSLAARHAATSFMVLLALFEALLLRVTHQQDLVVGTSIAGRGRPELEGLIGLFVNTLVLRTDLSGDPDLETLIARVKETTLAAYVHQDLPFERVVEALHPERDPRRSPLFQVAFDLQNLPPAAGRTAGLALTGVEAETGTAKFDLRLVLRDGESGFTGILEHATDLFTAATAARLARQLESLAAALTVAGRAPLSAAPCLGPGEIHQLLHEWNDTRSPSILGPADGILERFAAWVRRAPQALAVTLAGSGTESPCLTYGELDRRSETLARHLLARGLRPESLVGLGLQRSPDMVTALLAVLKAGAAYLPLDPRDPPERLAFLLADAGVCLLLTEQPLAAAFPAAGLPVILLGGVDLGGNLTGGRLAQPLPLAEQLAYVIYTSGSTGRPKGVMVTHGGLASYLGWCAEAYGTGGGAGALVATSLSFDLTVTGLLGPLVAGGTVRLLPEGGGSEALAEALRRERDLTLVKLTPSHLALLGRQLPPAELAGRSRALVIGGEALTAEILAPFLRHAPETRLINEYGPTETVVGCCVHEATPEETSSAVPIGRPISGATLDLLGPRGETVPPGVAGEIFIGGAGVARGYLQRPRLTAERFVPDPRCDSRGTPGARLYRTGDLGRRREDGTLEFLGRIDHQVKVRGFRVEPAEVEATLCRHPAVAQAVVLPVGKHAEERRLTAFVVPVDAGPPAGEGDLRAYLAEHLPAYMVPSTVVLLPELPQTSNGKLDRAALLNLKSRRPDLGTAPSAPGTGLERRLAELWQEVLGIAEIGAEDNFFDLGGHSLLLAQVHGRLRERFEVEIPLLDLFSYSTIRSLASRIEAQSRGAEEVPQPAPPAESRALGREIAVIGMAVRVPGADGPAGMWKNLRDGVESVTCLTDEQLLAAGVDPTLLADPRYVRTKAVLDGVDCFDSAFFRLTPRQATVMDPQQRFFLESAWEALEHAGYPPESSAEQIGLFAGSGATTYSLLLQSDLELVRAVGFYQVLLGNDKDHLATRTSYLLGLEGPSVTVQTSCSTSLVAVHLACQSLLSGECGIALAGGVSIDPQPHTGYLHQEGGILSPDGHCRPFDAAARGTVGGSGVGVVVLKPLSRALADGDTIHGVLLGSAINNDGSRKVGYTAPRIEGQAQVVREALARAGVTPGEISYVEAHGTGTELGDPIEVAALTRAFGEGAPRERSCALGSIKSNIGHLDTASGVVGLVKTILALGHRQIPPSLHLERPNPKIDFGGSFHVNTRLSEWPGPAPRRAGVSSFGIGGTNAHVIVEEAPKPAPPSPSRPWQLLTLSARTERALEASAGRLVDRLQEEPGLALPDVSFTLHVGRARFSRRRAVVCRDVREAIAALRGRPVQEGSVFSLESDAGDQPFVLLFPGQGVRLEGVGRELYPSEPVFRDAVDRCAELLQPHIKADLRSLLFGEAPGSTPDGRLRSTRYAQPALFALEYALAQLWTSWLGPPSALLGHSLGEYVAACLAGVFSLEDALALVDARGRLMQQTSLGAMLAVPLGRAELLPLLGEELSLAAANGPARSVISGPAAAVGALEGRLTSRGFTCRRLQTDRAFHSALMDPVLEPFAAELRGIELAPPRIPFLSNVSGTWATVGQVTDRSYWVEHLRSPVLFSAALEELWRSTEGPLLEVGPGRTLSGLAQQHPDRPPGREAFSVLPAADSPELRDQLVALGRIWAHGVPVRWNAFYTGERRLRVPLPTYPFERQSYWFTASRTARSAAVESAPAVPGPLRILAPTWERGEALRPPAAGASAEGVWLVFRDGSQLADDLIHRLRDLGREVVVASPGEAFAARAGAVVLPPSEGAGYVSLCEHLRAAGRPIYRIAHFWCLPTLAGGDRPDGLAWAALAGLPALAEALRDAALAEPCRVGIFASELHQILGDEPVHPAKAALLALCQPRSEETGKAVFFSVDVVLAPPADRVPDRLVDQLLAELAPKAGEPVVALRGHHRWVRTARPLAPAVVPEAPGLLRERGVYLMAGSLEGALAGYAGYLARAVRPRLVLAGSGLPPRSEWPDRLAGDGGFEEAEATARVEIEPAALAAEVDVREAALERGQGVRLMSEYEGLEAELDRFCASSALDFLKREGIDLAVGRRLPPGTLRRDLGVLPAFTKLLDALLAMLVEDGILAADGGELRVTATAGRIEPPAALRERLDTLYPEQHGLVWMVDHCVRHYGPALRGEIPAIGVLYPEGRTDLLDEADRDTVTSNFEGLYIRLLSETVAGLAPEAGRGRPLRILEVGGGTGSLTRPLLASLAGRSFTYLFTDLGKAFVRAAEAEAAKLGITGVSFRTLDIGQDLETQGLAPYEFDVVVGLNVVHATRSLRQTVRNLRRMLAPGGWLGLIENVRPSRCVDLIWGLAEGWWYFEDADLRTTSPLVGLATWERVLRDGGLESVTSWPRPGSRGSRQEIGLVLGRQASHLSFADPAYRAHLVALDAQRTRWVRAAIHLAQSLEAQGAEITLVPAPLDEREDSGIASAVRAARELHGVLHGALLAEGIEPQALREVEAVSSLDGAGFDLLVLSPPPPSTGADSAYLGAFAEARSAAGQPTRALFWNRPPESAEEAAQVLGQALSRELPQLWIEVTPQPAAPGGPRPADLPESAARPSGGSRLHSPAEHPLASPVALQVAHLWQEILGTEVSLTDNFFDLGGDSLVALSLTSRLRGELGVELSMRHILEAPTVEALAQLVERERARSLRTVRTHRAQLPPTVVEIQPGDSARLPFFTVHAAGGNVLCYYELARHLKQERPVYALEAPGLDGERTTFNRLEDLAAFHVGAVREFQPHGPYLLGGWSAGGTVAFEMAQQLRRLGERVLLVALMDTYAPKAGEHLDELGMLLWQAWRFRLTVTAEELERLGSYEERVDYLVRRGMESGVIPANVVDATQARRLLAIELSTLQAMLNYRPVVLDSELAYFRCEEGTDFGDFERLFPHVNQIDHAEAWREYSTRPMQVFVVPGHHQALMSEPGVAVLAQQLAGRIASLELAETD